MSLGENSLVAAYQGRGQLKSRPSGTRVVTASKTKNRFETGSEPKTSLPKKQVLTSLVQTSNKHSYKVSPGWAKEDRLSTICGRCARQRLKTCSARQLWQPNRIKWTHRQHRMCLN